MNLSNHFLDPHCNLKSAASHAKELHNLSTLCEKRHLCFEPITSSFEDTFWIGRDSFLLSPLYPTDDC